MTRVDVIVVSYRSGRHLRGALEPLSDSPGVRTIVVDNNPGDGSADVARELGAQIIEPGGNVGFARGCNAGAAASDAPYLLFLNPDARIDAANLHRLIGRLERDESLAVAAPRIENPAGRLHPSVQRDLRPVTALALATGLHRLTSAAWATDVVRDRSVYEAPGTVEWASGACLLVRRLPFFAVGGFHDGYWMYCEDADLCRTLRRYGWKVGFEPSAVATHVGGACGSRASLRPAYAHARLHYALRWNGRAGVLAVRAGLAGRGLIQAAARGGARADEVRGVLAALRPGAASTPAIAPAPHAPGPGADRSRQVACGRVAA